jgi:hypothetical protein
MKSGRCGQAAAFLLLVSVAGASLLGAADDTTTRAPATTNASIASQNDEIARMKATLAEQQKQLQALQQAMTTQQELLEKALASKSVTDSGTFNAIGQVVSTTPAIPVAPLQITRATPAIPAALSVANPMPRGGVMPLPQGAASSASTGNPCEAPGGGAVPAFLRLGDVCIVPIGFMDLTMVARDKNAGSGMGSNYGSVPFNNVVNGNLSEYRFTPQNSRIGFRIDGDWKGTHFIGYNEFDFNGTSGSSAITVTNGAFVPRLRLYWVDARKSRWEFLAGQSWSMLTPNRNGISALPGDLFYTQDVDINYNAGLTWTRQPGMRVLYHPGTHVTLGFSAENPDTYIGASAGGSGITLPAAYASLAGTQLDNTSGVLNASTVTPDFIAKLAIDYSRVHFELGGVERNFRIVNPALLSQHFTNEGAGLLVGLNVALMKNFRLITTNYWSDGGGRYLFGQAPDLIVRANGSISPIHSGGTIDGFEDTVGKTLLYAYYGAYYIGRDTAYDANGTTLIGYGFKGSANSVNRVINEGTFGFNRTIWRDPRYGAINLMAQWEWLERDPWYVAAGAPKATHDNTIYIDVRYSLPGSMPNF